MLGLHHWGIKHNRSDEHKCALSLTLQVNQRGKRDTVSRVDYDKLTSGRLGEQVRYWAYLPLVAREYVSP
jgi:hypothetical protein